MSVRRYIGRGCPTLRGNQEKWETAEARARKGAGPHAGDVRALLRQKEYTDLQPTQFEDLLVLKPQTSLGI